MKISSRRLHHRFMLSRYTKLTTTRCRREWDLNQPRTTKSNRSVGPDGDEMLTKGERHENRCLDGCHVVWRDFDPLHDWGHGNGHVEGFEKMIPQRV
jgi:hypothetical protein